MVSENSFKNLTKNLNLAIFWSLKLCLCSMCGANSVWKFAPHMEGSHADFALHMERRYSFRDQIIAKTASFANFKGNYLKQPIEFIWQLLRIKIFWSRGSLNSLHTSCKSGFMSLQFKKLFSVSMSCGIFKTVSVHHAKKRPLFFKLKCLPRRAFNWKVHFLVLLLKCYH